MQLDDGPGPCLELGEFLPELGPLRLLSDQLFVYGTGRRAVSGRLDKPPNPMPELAETPRQFASLAPVLRVQFGALGAVIADQVGNPSGDNSRPRRPSISSWSMRIVRLFVQMPFSRSVGKRVGRGSWP